MRRLRFLLPLAGLLPQADSGAVPPAMQLAAQRMALALDIETRFTPAELRACAPASRDWNGSVM